MLGRKITLAVELYGIKDGWGEVII